MNTLTLTTEIGAVAGTCLYLVDIKEKKIKTEHAKNMVCTTVVTGATAIASYTINQQKLNEIHEKYTTSYVDSLNEEQLAAALERMDLLLPEETTKEDVKTL